MWYKKGELIVGEKDVKMGEIGGEKVYIRGKKYEEWKNNEIIIDVVKGRGGML